MHMTHFSVFAIYRTVLHIIICIIRRPVQHVKTHFAVMLLVLCVQWQKRNLPATSLESHSNDGDDSVKQYISVGIQELSVYASLEM